MKSDFSAARACLDRASQHLGGNDETSERAREALDLLVEAVLVAEHSQPREMAEVLRFPSKKRRGVKP